MNPQVSSTTFDTFFAWAPWVIGIVIYSIFYIAKRHEKSSAPASGQATYSCAACGRRGSLDQMVPQRHAGATGYYCAACAPAQVAAQ